jgi:hypothetical protein
MLELLFAKLRAQIVHQTTKTKLLRIRLTMVMLILSQRNNPQH